MSATLHVYLNGTPIGMLLQSSSGNTTFEYGAYRDRIGATPLSLSMPMTRRLHKKRAVDAFLKGLLPDSPKRLDQLASEFGVSPRNPFALLAHVGEDAAGAVQILPWDARSTDGATRQGDVAPLSDSDFAAEIADVVANKETWGRRANANVRWSSSRRAAETRVVPHQ